MNNRSLISIFFITVINTATIMSCNNISHEQFSKTYSGKIIRKDSLDHDEYELYIKDINGKKDTVYFALGSYDYKKVDVGDSFEKKRNLRYGFLFKNGCNDSTCAVKLTLIDLLF